MLWKIEFKEWKEECRGVKKKKKSFSVWITFAYLITLNFALLQRVVNISFLLFPSLFFFFGVFSNGDMGKVFLIGKDFGAFPVSLFALLHPDRLLGFVTLGVPFMLPTPQAVKYEQLPEGFYISRWRVICNFFILLCRVWYLLH